MPVSFAQPLSRSLAALALVALLASMAQAQSDPPLGPGDMLLVRAIAQPEVGGKYLVQADGAVSLPLLGRITVAGLRPGEVDAALARIFRERRISTQPEVSVEIARYRDFFVSGDVASPGAYAWRPGLTVRQALALAGGRDLLPGDGSGSATQSEDSLGVLTRQIAALDANRARLDAESAAIRSGDFITDSPSVAAAKVDWPEMPADDDARALIAAQQALMTANLGRDRATVASLTARQAALTARRAALREQQSTLEEEDTILAERLSTVKGLNSSGLAPLPQVLEVRQTILEVASSRLDVMADLADADGSVAEIDLERNSFRDVRLAGLASELLQVRGQLLEARARLGAAERAARPSAGPEARPGPAASLSVVRETAPGPVPVAEDDPLQPGDTLIVPSLAKAPAATASNTL